MSSVPLQLVLAGLTNIFRLVPFVIIVCTFEELIPIMALYTPRMLPSTIVFPAQRERIERRKADKQIEHRIIHRLVFEEMRELGPVLDISTVRRNSSHLAALCGEVGLPTWGPGALKRYRLNQHLLKVSADDNLLRREGLGPLSHREIVEALYERGM